MVVVVAFIFVEGLVMVADVVALIAVVGLVMVVVVAFIFVEGLVMVADVVALIAVVGLVMVADVVAFIFAVDAFNVNGPDK
jgi:hypothetical protein